MSDVVAARPRTAAMLGPAFVAAVAYIDPGNFATNITAGAQFGYALVWVVVTANFVAMATDLAEFVGAALGLYLLFGVPLPIAGLITAVVSFGLLDLTRRGYRPFEIAIAGLLGIVFLGFAYSLLSVSGGGPAPDLVYSTSADGMLVLAVGNIGATVMPHVIYLHSALTKVRRLPPTRQVLRSQRLDVVLALGTAGLINVAMLVLAAAVLPGLGEADPIMFAHSELGRVLGGGAALAFAVALLASGLSSSSVGTYAGQVVMSGFIRRSIPLVVRRGVTMLPALVVLSLGLPVTESLVISQVVLSFGIPFALIPLVLLTRRADVMGPYVNLRVTTAVAGFFALVVTGLNLYLATSVVLG